jgi:hypothetical protein
MRRAELPFGPLSRPPRVLTSLRSRLNRLRAHRAGFRPNPRVVVEDMLHDRGILCGSANYDPGAGMDIVVGDLTFPSD